MSEEIFLAFIVSIDIYLAAAAYCNDGIRIPPSSAAVIAAVGAAVLGVSVKFSKLIGSRIPDSLCHRLSTFMLLLIGVFVITKSITRTLFRRISDKGGVSVKFKGMSVVLKLYLDDTAADFDNSKTLSIGEAAALAAASSLDCAAIGLGTVSGHINPSAAAFFAFIWGCIALALGNLTGKKISALDRDLSWLGGILLIIFALVD